MSFTEAQRVSIRTYLGYPSVSVDSSLDGAIDAAGQSPAIQSQVEAILAQLALVDAKQTGVLGQAGIKRADEIEFFEGSSLRDVGALGRTLVRRLAALLGVGVAVDIYGGGRVGYYDLR